MSIITKEYVLPTYNIEATNKEQIIERIMHQTQVFNIKTYKQDLRKLPYSYMSLKVTKEVADVRFIAGSFNSAMQPISMLINTLLNAIKPLVRQLWDSLFLNNNLEIQDMWLIESSLEVKERLAKFNRSADFKLGKPQEDSSTYDVKTLYTRLPHEDIAKRLSKLLDNIEIMVKNKIQIEVRYNDSIIHLGNKLDLIGKVHDKI